MQLPSKAIIAVAGLGTRFLPATKAVPKEMLPMIDKPIVQYAVEEVVAAGVKDVILVTRQANQAVKNHFRDNPVLESQLKQAGKKEQLKKVKDISKMANFIFLEQKDNMPYGNAIPLKLAAGLVSSGPFFYLYGDDMTLAQISVCRQLMEVYKKNPDAAAVVGVQRMPKKELDRYGVVKIKQGQVDILDRVIEKPKINQAPSDMVVFGRFLFTPKILSSIAKLKKGKAGELWLSDALDDLARREKVVVCRIQGEWLTTGDPLNYLKTMLDFVWQRKELKEELKRYIVEKLRK